jgi:hypothetical protein
MVLIEVVPLLVQPVKSPVSNPPLMMLLTVVPVTVTVTGVLWTALPSVPVTVTVYVPAGVNGPVLTVSVDELPAVTEVGLSAAVGPFGGVGETVAVRLTVPAEPLVTAVLIVEMPLLLCAIERLVGLALMEKSFVTVPPQPGNLKEPMRVFQLKLPLAGIYWFVYQKVQSSLGSTTILL